MAHRRAHTVALMLCWGAGGGVAAVEDSASHRFGERVAVTANLSLIVTRQNASESRSRYPTEFKRANGNLVVFSLRFEGKGGAYFRTDMSDPARSDVVALCGEERVNILALGSGAVDDRKTRRSAESGDSQILEGRWAGIVAGGAPPTTVAFVLPANCAPERVQLAVGLEAVESGKKEKVQLLFTDRPRESPPSKP